MPHLPQRLKGFNYRTPFFYMVTFHASVNLPRPFSAINGKGCVPGDVTKAFLRIIRGFHSVYPEIAPITCFTIMPDHLHLLIRMQEGPFGKSLIEVVEALKESLAQAYARLVELPAPRVQKEFENYIARSPHVFAAGFHDHIVWKTGQLKRFTQYIRENPLRAWLRRQGRERGWFNRVRVVAFAGQRWYAYGNLALLDLPTLEVLQGHRATQPGTPAWQMLLDRAARLGPGCAGVSTFMSAHEKACGRAIGLAGGNWIVLSPRGFPSAGEGGDYESPEGVATRWHPSRAQEKWCARGHMLFLSLWEGDVRRLSNVELGLRCAEMWRVVHGADALRG